MWWVDIATSPSDAMDYDFYATGNYGQFIYVILDKNMIIMRHGYKSGYNNWTGLFRELASKI